MQVAVIGLGLLGASLGMALRGKGVHRLGWTRRENIRRWALDCDVIDETAGSLPEILAKADITIFAMPVPPIIRTIEENAEYFRPGSIVSDLGSVKSGVMEAGKKHLLPRKVHFIGGHPMAGTEKSGPESAFPTLYDNADVFLCPFPETPADKLETLKNLWESLNTHVVTIASGEHDDLVAHTSHVLHILASALTLSILDGADAETIQRRFAGCATGFRDTSRIASSNPVMWREIIAENREYVLKAMADFDLRYEKFKNYIQSGDFDGFEKEFAAGKLLRDRWVDYKNKK